MKDQRAGDASLRPDSTLEKLRREFGGLAVMDLPADDLPAPDVDDEIEVEEAAGDRPRPPRPKPTSTQLWKLNPWPRN
jgi:hypothetical protein